MAEPVKKTTFTRKPRKTARFAEDPEDDGKKTSTTTETEIKSSQLPGSRVSVISGKPVISSGHAFIDNAWGGGIGVGQLVLVSEDINSTYYQTLLQLYIAQGTCLPDPHNSLIISSEPSSFLPLPKPLHLSSNHAEEKPSEGATKLKIAWRYDQNLKEKANPSGTRRQPFSNVFDLHKTMELSEEREKLIEQIVLDDIHRQTSGKNTPCSSAAFFANLLELIQIRVEKAKQESKVLRIILHSFGSPEWLENRTPSVEKEMVLFLHKLKGLLKNSTSTCVISFPQHLFSNYVLHKIQRLSDVACKFDSFQGETDTEVDPAFADYHGHFVVSKLPRTNSLTRHMPDTPSYVFARKRHKFVVEVFSLPPELTRATENSASQSAAKSMCQSGPPKPSVLDF